MANYDGNGDEFRIRKGKSLRKKEASMHIGWCKNPLDGYRWHFKFTKWWKLFFGRGVTLVIFGKFSPSTTGSFFQRTSGENLKAFALTQPCKFCVRCPLTRWARTSGRKFATFVQSYKFNERIGSSGRDQTRSNKTHENIEDLNNERVILFRFFEIQCT